MTDQYHIIRVSFLSNLKGQSSKKVHYCLPIMFTHRRFTHMSTWKLLFIERWEKEGFSDLLMEHIYISCWSKEWTRNRFTFPIRSRRVKAGHLREKKWIQTDLFLDLSVYLAWPMDAMFIGSPYVAIIFHCSGGGKIWHSWYKKALIYSECDLLDPA